MWRHLSVVPRHPVWRWEVTDPSGKSIDLVQEVSDDIEKRVRRLMTGLEISANP